MRQAVSAKGATEEASGIKPLSGGKTAGSRVRASDWQGTDWMHAALDAATDAIAVMDADLRLRFANRALGDWLGRPAPSLQGLLLSDFLPAPLARDLIEGDRQVLDTGVSLEEERLIELKGQRRWISLKRNPLMHQGRRIGVMVVAHDVTARHDSESALRDSLELQERFFAQGVAGIAYLDRAFNFIRVNEAYARYGQRQPGDYVGRNHFELYPHRENQALFQRVIRTGEPYLEHARPFRHPDQPERGITYWDIGLQPVHDNSGEVSGLVMTLADVTEQHQSTLEKALILGSITDLVCFFAAPDMRVTWSNAAYGRQFSRAPEALVGQYCHQLIQHRDQPCAGCPVIETFATGQPSESRQTLADGRECLVRSFPAYAEEQGQRRLTGVVEVARDMTDLARAERNFRTAFDENPSPMALLDAVSLCLIEANDALLSVLARTRSEVLGQTLISLGLETNGPLAQARAGRYIAPNESFEVRLRLAEGSHFIGEAKVRRMTTSSGEVLLLIIHDVTDARRLMEALEHRANHDSLTGIPNRDSLLKVIRQLKHRRHRDSAPSALIMLDVDHFKTINDRFGHPEGDRVLRAVVDSLNAGLRTTDRIARWGGEEFLILLPDTDTQGALQLAERLRARLLKTGFPAVGQVTASFGVAMDDNDLDEQTWIDRADEALYAAKAAGRNQVHLWRRQSN
ncbi:putative diguanylate cyclase YdaM [Thiorhodovibrio winogradskyi]|uniref:Diguanylate cyclase YdaM n=1 Tax=Thiorhodovibrio winogradskyi TaxID=77007 RepID=A0ABZ0S491_9GAMM|nr:PAS domain-containing protein [Thiorhodovibrio winogradskyi]